MSNEKYSKYDDNNTKRASRSHTLTEENLPSSICHQ